MKRLFTSLMLVLTLLSAVFAQSTAAGATKLEGQIVCCEDCWAKADRKTVVYGILADIEAAKGCIANGDPSLLAVMDAKGEATFYQLAPGNYKREGKDWHSYVGKRVTITGPVSKKKGKNVLKVDELAVLASAPAEQELASASKIIGSEVPLTLKDLFGADQSLSGYRGRVVILNFWATYCVPCRTEMPDLAAIQNEYAALGVQVIGAAADGAEDREKILKFVKETKLNFPVWVGASAADMMRFGLGSALPGTVVIGRDGKVIAQFRGVVSQNDLRKQLQNIISADTKQAKGQLASSASKKTQASSVPS